MKRTNVIDQIGGEVPTNGAEEIIANGKPYIVDFTLTGTADLIFHRWDCEAVEEKSKAAKNSKSKKTDNIESYLYRNEKDEICIPGEYVRQSTIHSAKFIQDPRSPRKSAMDLFKAGVVSYTNLSSLGIKKPDYEDKRRAVVQRQGINRVRPAIKAGWVADFQFMILLPEYISPKLLHDVLANAGKLVGIGDFRPTYGRFQITSFNINDK
jgi:hypothetical protein